MKEFGQIQAQSSLDDEMAEMSIVEKMSYLQFQMHFDESMESIADSDLKDGELKKVADITTVCPKTFWETRCNCRSGERGKCTKSLIHQRIRELPGDRLHCFHQDVMNKETKCGAPCSETPICRN